MFKAIKMNKTVLVFAMVAILGSLLIQLADATSDIAPPELPEEFNSPEEIEAYLKLLHNYYKLVGRPR